MIKLAEGATEQTYILKVSAIGKYPFITIDSTNLDFENLLVGKTASKEINVQNSSPVPTNFEITKVSDDGKDQSFSLSTTKGHLNPGQISTITLKYTPSIAGTVSCAYYKISAAGGNELEFSCKGQADGYDVQLSASSIHFGEVQHQSMTNRLLNVHNSSDLPTSFQFITDKNNVFGFSQTEGIVKPHSFCRIIISFNP